MLTLVSIAYDALFCTFVELPLGSNIWIFTKSVTDLERDDFGIYELLDATHDVIYIGGGKVRCLLAQHFADGQHPITGAQWFSAEYTWDESKANARHEEEMAKYHKKHGRYPKFNNS